MLEESAQAYVKSRTRDNTTEFGCGIADISRNKLYMVQIGDFNELHTPFAEYLYACLEMLIEIGKHEDQLPTNIQINLNNMQIVKVMSNIGRWYVNHWVSVNGLSAEFMPTHFKKYIKILKDIVFVLKRLPNKIEVHYVYNIMGQPILNNTLSDYLNDWVNESHKSNRKTYDDKRLDSLSSEDKSKQIPDIINSDKGLNLITQYDYALPVKSAKHLNLYKSQIMKQMSAHNWYDIVTFFPSNKKYQTINNVITDNSTKFLKDGQRSTFDIVRVSEVKQGLCKNGSVRTYFAFHIIGKPDFKLYASLFDYKHVVWLKQHLLFKLTGVYSKKYNSFSHLILRSHAPRLINSVGKYGAIHGIPQGKVSSLILRTYLKHKSQIHDLIPPSIRKKYRFLPRTKAIYQCHFPKDPSNKKAMKLAKDSEKYNELYHYGLVVTKQGLKLKKRSDGISIADHKDKIKKAIHKFEKSLPYELTHDQKEASRDIIFDLEESFPMRRLLQGDTGSGKTVVSACATLAMIVSGYQVALMAPTSVLAEQHYQTFKKFFKPFHIKIGLLTGNTKDRSGVNLKIANGAYQLIIGTHALYSAKTKYRHLGLAIIDEQQRFGSQQRNALLKSKGCNMLSMTATPIPRSLALAIYGQTDTSKIKQMPKGRKNVITKAFPQNSTFLTKLLYYINSATKHHGQAFVIAKLVKRTKRSKKGLTSAVGIATFLRKHYQDSSTKIGLVHGRMNEQQKDKVLRAFAEHKYDVLVSTSVVGVGVDVPGATMMIVLNAERYGLSQLHQLRGRVGRNDKQAYCILFNINTSKASAERMTAMEKTDNGFKISKIDLKMRHAGNIEKTGRNQSGLPDFRLADLKKPHDMDLLNRAMKDAHRVLRNRAL